MSKAKSTFKKNDVKRAIAAVESAGLTTARVEFGKDGFAIIPGSSGGGGGAGADGGPGRPENGPQLPAETALDGWMASHARSA